MVVVVVVVVVVVIMVAVVVVVFNFNFYFYINMPNFYSVYLTVILINLSAFSLCDGLKSMPSILPQPPIYY